MNKRVCFILAEYLPYASSNSICIEPFMIALKGEGYDVDVYTRRQSRDLDKISDIDGLMVYRIDDRLSINIIKLNSGKTSKLNKILKLLYYLRYYGRIGERRYGGWSCRKVINVIQKNIATRAYDCIISVSYPSKTHEIAEKLKGKYDNIKWIYLQFDPLSYNRSEYGNLAYKLWIKQEERWMKKSDRIFVTRELMQFYHTTKLKSFIPRMDSFMFPNLQPINVDKKSVLTDNTNSIISIYAGALSQDIRNPIFMLKCWKYVDDAYKLVILTGNKIEYTKEACIELGDRIKILPKQPVNIARAMIIDSNIAVSIGNTIVHQTPGKIMELMSMGLPIIHFSKIANDPALFYLKDYPMLCVIPEYSISIEEAAKKITAFIKEFKLKRLLFEEVEEAVSVEIKKEVIIKKFLDDIDKILR